MSVDMMPDSFSDYMLRAKGQDKIVVDVWSGPKNQIHAARFVRPIKEAMQLASTELVKGFLINLRSEVAWGGFEEFDLRTTQ